MLIVLSLCFCITFLCGCVVVADNFRLGIAIIVFSFIFIVVIAIELLYKCNNFIQISENLICHKNESFDWNNVFITIRNFRRWDEKGFSVYLYFDDHYLSDDEAKSKEVQRKGFYMYLTPERTAYILQYYNKAVRLLDEPWVSKVSRILHEHNKKYDDPREFL